MKQIVCELCGCTRFSKEDGWFICGGCGTRYSQAEARNMLREVPDAPGAAGPEPAAPVQPPETAERSEKLLLLARRAKESNDSVTAAKYYQELLLEEPENWEAAFYTIYFDAMNGKIAQIGEAAARVSNSLDYVFELIKKRPREEWEKDSVEVVGQVSALALMLSKNAADTIRQNASGPLFYTTQETNAMIDRNPQQAFATLMLLKKNRDVAGPNANSWFAPIGSMLINLGDKLHQEMGWNYGQVKAVYDVAASAVGVARNLLFRQDSTGDELKKHMAAIGMQDVYETYMLANQRKKDAEWNAQQEERQRKEQERERIRLYWEEHTEERDAIVGEAAELQRQADGLQKEIWKLEEETNRENREFRKSAGPLEQQYRDLETRIREKERVRNSLGLFKGKEKQRLTDEIEKLRKQQPDETDWKREKADRERAFRERTKPLQEEIRQLRTSWDELNRKADALRAKLTRIPEEKA